MTNTKIRKISVRENLPPQPLDKLIRYGFWLSVLLFFYGTLIPFDFDFSAQSLSRAWSNVELLPYWSAERGRIPSIPDMVANVLLTLPIGFFGFLLFDLEKKKPRIAKWFLIVLVLSALTETLQLAVPSRTSGITDVINNGFGAGIGATFAWLMGRQIIAFFSGSLLDKKYAYFWMVLAVIAFSMLAPFDVTQDVSYFRASLKALLTNPWETGIPVDNEWILMAEFAILGAIAFSLKKARFVIFALSLPFAMEFAQLFIASHAPSLRSLAINCMAAAAGILGSRMAPALARPLSGFIIVSAGIIAAGLSPYDFVTWKARSSFQLMPLVEYYFRTTPAALYDAISGLLTFALLAGLLKLWCRCPRWMVIGWCVGFSGAIEVAQLFLPARYAGVTDMVIAGIGAWVGSTLIWGQATQSPISAN